MTRQPYQPIIWLILTSLILGLVAQIGLPLPAQANEDELPPRETPTPPPSGHEKNKAGPPIGAYIELAAPVGTWGIVQWQDSAGGWHNVEGWQGLIVNSSRWWVHPKDFGTGPFRWAMLNAPGGAVLKVSEPFQLPTGANETTLVTVNP